MVLYAVTMRDDYFNYLWHMYHFYEVYEKAATDSVKLHLSTHPLSLQLSVNIPTSELQTYQNKNFKYENQSTWLRN
jgi:hypothetical protein